MLLATVGGPKQPLMYRYSVDNAVTYTSEDIVLFRESPFACWMERLTLENPDHGIPPDRYSKPPANEMQRQDELAVTLRAEGKHVTLIDWDADEAARRARTLEAMRSGVDYIVNGQLALGPLSGSANLLMRTSGYSELGNYLYIPCDTQVKTTLNSAFRLCFLADLLHSLQGQLPPQMLIIRGGSDLVPLETEDHIYHYQAVKQRFMQTMRDFRKHRMPDPAESAQFGRWSECANEVLKQRALRGEEPVEESLEQEPQEQSLPLRAAAAASAAPEPATVHPQGTGFGSKGIPVGDTLASQAQHLAPRALHNAAETFQPVSNRGSLLDAALQNLEFIGSSNRAPSIGVRDPKAESPRPEVAPSSPSTEAREQEAEPPAEAEPESPPPGPELVTEILPTEGDLPSLSPLKPHPLDSVSYDLDVSYDIKPPELPPEIETSATPPPVLDTDNPEFEIDCVDDSDYRMPVDPTASPLDARLSPVHDIEPARERATTDQPEDEPVPDIVPSRPFSSSLNTADFEDI